MHASLQQRLKRVIWASWFEKARLPWLLQWVLFPLTLLYALIVCSKSKPPKGKTPHLPPVIVVGNLIVGGAGKTPIVAALCDALKQAGYVPGIITRGYGRLANDITILNPSEISGTTLETLSQRAGDEPAWLCHTTQQPVAIGAKRADALKMLIKQHPTVNVVISDDGLQHQALVRQFEIVVFDERLAGNGKLLPMGPLREPLSRLGSVDAVIFSNCRPDAAFLEQNRSSLEHLSLSLSELSLTSITQWSTGLTLSWEDWTAKTQHQSKVMVAGMGHPAKFFNWLASKGVQARALPEPDHYAYPTGYLDNLPEQIIITTGKDAVKLPKTDPRLWVVNIRVSLPNTLVDRIKECLVGP